MELRVGDYLLVLSDEVEHETFRCDDYHGVSFFYGDQRFEVLHNVHMGPRLLITHRTEYGHLRDIPFNMNTAFFLPPCVTVTHVPFV